MAEALLCGVPLSEVRRLSLRQLVALVEYFDKRAGVKRAELAMAVRMSQADGKDFKKYLKEIQ